MKPSRQLEMRARYVRTWQNSGDTNGGQNLLRNAPGGFPSAGPSPSRVWKGSDRLSEYGFGPYDDGGYWSGMQNGYITIDRTGWSGDPASLPAVGRATSLIVDTLAGLPWKVVRGRETVDPPPVWVTDPMNRRGDSRFGDGSPVDDGYSAVSWRAQFLIGLLWYGDGFIYVPRRAADRTPLPPVYVIPPYEVETVTPWSEDSQRRPGHYVTGTDLRFDPEQIIHVRGEGPYDLDGRGLGVLARYAASYGLLGDIGQYGSSTFRSGVPAGVLKVNTPNVSDAQAESLRSKWEDRHGPRRGIAVLNSITDFVPIAFSPIDAALIESKRLSMLDVALAFGVEPYMLGLPTDSATYANVESRMLQFSQFTLLPWCRRVESGLDSEFAYGTNLHLDLRGLMRADTAVRVAAYHDALTDGWMTTDEVRELEDLPPMTAAQRRETKPAPPLALAPPIPPAAPVVPPPAVASA